MSENHNLIIESKERAERLKRIRNLANLSRKELCDQANININTYIGYEVGRYGGLTKKGAEKVLHYIVTCGVYSSLDWLMYGVGQSPRVVTDIPQVLSDKKHVSAMINKNQEEENITEEIYLFHKHYSKAIDYQISDDGMSPIYTMSDYVAGISNVGSAIKNCIGADCIVQMADGIRVVRNLREGRVKGRYTLSCINPNTVVTQPILYDVELLSAAKIIWHRRIYQTLKTKKENAIC